MVQETYEAAMTKLRSLAMMRANLQQRLVELHTQGLSKCQEVHTLERSVRDIDTESVDTHKVIMACRASR